MNHGVLVEGHVKSSVSIKPGTERTFYGESNYSVFPIRTRSRRSICSLREVHWSDLKEGGVKAKGQASTGSLRTTLLRRVM